MDKRNKTIIRKAKNRNNPYVMINKSVLEDANVSFKAKGIMSYILGKPDDWKIMIVDLIKKAKDGRDSVYSGLAELKKHGYIQEIAYRERNKIVAREYVVYESPELNPYPPDKWGKVVHIKLDSELDPENPDKGEELDPDFPDQGKADQGNQDQGKRKLLNTDSTDTDSTDMDSTNSKYVGSVDEILDTFSQAYEMTKYARQKLTEFVEMYGVLLVSEALDRAIAAERNTPIAYIRAILQNWAKAGVQTIEDILEYERKFREQQKQKKESKKKQPKQEGDKLPVADQGPLDREKAREQQPPADDKNNESLAEKRARIQQKLKKMRDGLSTRGKRA